MAEMMNFTQPDTSPTFLIEFLEFLDNYQFIKTLRNQSNQSLNISAGLTWAAGSAVQPCPSQKSPDRPA